MFARDDEAVRPDLVIFDCDGVLVDSEPVVTRAESEYFRTLGSRMEADEMRRRFQGKTVADVADAVAAEIGRPLTADELYAWGIATARALAGELQTVPGVRTVVERVAAAGIRLCVASQSPEPRVRLSLAVTSLGQAFGDRVFTASMVERPKPAPDLFLYAARRMGVDPARAVVIEDSVSGVFAARAAGMRVFGYASDEGFSAEQLAAAGARVVRAMDELPSLLELD